MVTGRRVARGIRKTTSHSRAACCVESHGSKNALAWGKYEYTGLKPERLKHVIADDLALLAAHRVRFVGEPAKRISEDVLRVLRYYRFEARFGSGTGEIVFNHTSANYVFGIPIQGPGSVIVDSGTTISGSVVLRMPPSALVVPMFSTVTLLEQLFSIPSNAANPLKLAP